MIDISAVEDIVNKHLLPDKEFVVELNIATGNKITVLIDSDESISIDRCVAVSRAIEESLDREVEDFELEVSSAGLTSPLKVLRQYKKHRGEMLEVLLVTGSKIKGKLLDVTEKGIALEVEEMVKPEGKKRKEIVVNSHALDFSQIKKAVRIISFR